MKQIPNIFTLLNLFFGCMAIVCVLQNGIVITETNEGAQMLELPAQIWLASLCIGIAAIVDFLDGFVARLFNATSELGKQLDSLADVVSFGVAPAMIIYQFLRLSIAKQEDGLNQSILWLLPAFILPCAAAYRLGKFNIDNRQTYVFRGVPVPAVGLTLASFPLIYWHANQEWQLGLLTNQWFLYVVIASLSWLMLSDLPIMSNKFKSKSVKDNFPKIILIVLAIIAIIILKWLSVPVIFLAYVILSLIFQKQIQ